MGIGDWGLGIGDWGLGIAGNSESAIAGPQFSIGWLLLLKLLNKNKN